MLTLAGASTLGPWALLDPAGPSRAVGSRHMCINSCISKCKFFLCSRNPVLIEPPTTWDGNLGCVCAWLLMGGRDARPSVNLPAPAARRPPAAGCPWTPGCPWERPMRPGGSRTPRMSAAGMPMVALRLLSPLEIQYLVQEQQWL